MQKAILTIAVAVCFGAGFVQSLRAQTQPISYPQQTLEDLRTELLNLVDGVQECSVFVPAELIDTASLKEARDQIQNMPLQSLNVFRRVVDPARLHDRLRLTRPIIAQYAAIIQRTPQTPQAKKFAVRPQAADDPFPDKQGFCPNFFGSSNSRIPNALVLAADVTWFAADTTRELLQDACKQDVVVAGEGGNTSSLCGPVDVTWVIAKAVHDTIHFCDDDLTGAVVDANYARLDDVHTDLVEIGTSVGNLDAHLTNVNNQITSEFAAVTNQINSLSAQLTNATNQLSAQITAATNQLSAQITQATTQLVSGEEEILRFTTASLSFSPQSQNLSCSNQFRPILTVSAPAPPGDLLIMLKSDNVKVATVPASILIPAGSNSVTVHVSCVAPGTTLIHANAVPFVPDVTASVTFL
jgi:hypothetical protein